MNAIRFFAAILFLASWGLANSAGQTDWSGGPGITGPVDDWGDRFRSCTSIGFASTAGSLELAADIEEILISGSVNTASSVCAADLNGDGFCDVAAATSNYEFNLFWFENQGPSGTTWITHVIEDGFMGATCVYPVDIDSDGDVDLLAAIRRHQLNDSVELYLNDGGAASWTRVTLDSSYYGCKSVSASDIDGDGDMDVIASSMRDDDICWFENEDGIGTSWGWHQILTGFDGAWSVHAADIDGDGDSDVLGAARDAGTVSWVENADGSGTSWVEHPISNEFRGARDVYSADFDADGDQDVVASADNARLVMCWENVDGSGSSWNGTVVATDVCAFSVFPEDMDEDHDYDIVTADYLAGDVIWYENSGTPGGSWLEHVVNDDFPGATDACVCLIDTNSRMDIVGAAYTENTVSWWDISSIATEGRLLSSILELPAEPEWDYVEWNATTPSGTSAGLQIRASSDASVMGEWSDTLYTPCMLDKILADGDEFVQYRVILLSEEPGVTPSFRDVLFTWDPMGTGGGGQLEPALLPFSPNPCSSPVARFSLPEPAAVELAVFDLTGRMVSMTHQEYTTGYHDVCLDELASGVYFCRMIKEGFAAMQSFVVVD